MPIATNNTVPRRAEGRRLMMPASGYLRSYLLD
jgi:hypothetical protein